MKEDYFLGMDCFLREREGTLDFFVVCARFLVRSFASPLLRRAALFL